MTAKNNLDYAGFLTPKRIWNIKQNRPSLIAKDLERFGIDKQTVYSILLGRGVFKWLAVRRDIIKLKNTWRDRLTALYQAQHEHPTEYRKGYIAALEECRKEVRALCHSDRFRAPDFDREANEFLSNCKTLSCLEM